MGMAFVTKLTQVVNTEYTKKSFRQKQHQAALTQ
jgi:hypothetical protein